MKKTFGELFDTDGEFLTAKANIRIGGVSIPAGSSFSEDIILGGVKLIQFKDNYFDLREEKEKRTINELVVKGIFNK